MLDAQQAAVKRNGFCCVLVQLGGGGRKYTGGLVTRRLEGE